MKVLHGINQVSGILRQKRPILAIGIFDGVHLGHQYLIKRMVRRARAVNGTAMVMTFDPHPIRVLRPDIDLPMLVPLSCRLDLIRSLGVDACLVVRFTKAFSKLTPDQFIQRYLAKGLGVREVFVGDDFRFGENRSGNLDLFKEAGTRCRFKVNVVKALQKSGDVISSTLIRKYIREGKLIEAGRLLGRKVAIVGKVVRGDSRGRRLGYPTANIQPQSDTVPPPGVYVVRVILDGKVHFGMANVGTRPSFPSQGNRVHVEAHIFDFHKNIYGRTAVIEILRKIREEKPFPSEQALISQIRKDEIKARKLLSLKSLRP